ncbi:MAG: hypothetical protein HOF61_09485 [Verrucomicrobia bacterium]|nr:hypothetical protein [Verrucomicrobiota bacterium]
MNAAIKRNSVFYPKSVDFVFKKCEKLFLRRSKIRNSKLNQPSNDLSNMKTKLKTHSRNTFFFLPALIFLAGVIIQTHAGEKKYTVYQLLSKDYNTINAETRNGQDRIVITGIFPSGDEIKAGLLERDWCVTLPEIELKKLKFGGGSLCINLDQQTLTGEASCEPAFLGGASIAGSFTAGREGLRDIALVADDMGIPIGTTPAMLQKIGASLKDLHKNPGWSVTGNLGISVGKKKIADKWPV